MSVVKRLSGRAVRGSGLLQGLGDTVRLRHVDTGRHLTCRLDVTTRHSLTTYVTADFRRKRRGKVTGNVARKVHGVVLGVGRTNVSLTAVTGATKLPRGRMRTLLG